MAIQTFSFIKGNRVENALSYRLLYQSEDGSVTDRNNYSVAVTQEFIQSFDIPGALGTNGEPYVELFPHGHTVDEMEDNFSIGITTITKETQSGPEHYVTFEGKMTVETDERVFTGVPFKGRRYFEEHGTYKFKFKKNLNVKQVGNGPETGEWIRDGIRLWAETEVEDPRVDYLWFLVYGLDDSQDVVSATVEEIYIGGASTQFRHTTFIPIDCLTDDLNGYCVGTFNEEHDAYIPYYKICFYDEKFAFLHGVGYNKISEVNNSGFLTVEQVKTLGVNQAAKYVRFNSRSIRYGLDGEDTSPDMVSVGHIFFPLFHYPDSVIFPNFASSVTTLNQSFRVEAVGDGLFFTDSPMSDAEEYSRHRKIHNTPPAG